MKDLLKVKSIVTLVLIFTFAGVIIFKTSIPPDLKEILILVLGFYFGKGQAIKNE